MCDLRARIANQAENIVRDLLIENQIYIYPKSYVWGRAEKLSAILVVQYAGRWYDFSSGEGCDLARREVILLKLRNTCRAW
ncbi:hypothetical protein OCHUTO_1014 [Orientia chuto str. Dubai]|uniref:Uncharacterized protein n=1 Tax=Orientia chuto str. Dubai TaxID=1359168 RepID=A0A0F3MK83_9RICK|nr:hypothetical protein [Candidatus Orientia mediorientalis]KJV55014.1 hypothetical protein OCHUTO_1014 [Orientia chuto str. Dubai]